MIYDCFTFFNELDLLEIRLNVLNDVVDKFVLVEATKTFSGNDKPLYFEQNKDRFKEFQDKIIHIIVEDYLQFKNAWEYENHQRNCISRGLVNCKDDDTIMISDLDEIPKPEMVKESAYTGGIKLFEQNMYYYFINYINVTDPIWICGTKMLSYANFLNILDNEKTEYNMYLPEKYNNGTTANKIRHYRNAESIPNAGWHFSYCGGVEAIIHKIKSFSHQEFNSSEYTNPETIKEKIKNGKDILGRKELKYEIVELDSTFPKYILDNQEKYQSLIYSASKWYFFRGKTLRILKQKFLRPLLKFMACFLPVKKWRKKLRAYAE